MFVNTPYNYTIGSLACHIFTYKGFGLFNNNGFWIWWLGYRHFCTTTADYKSSHAELLVNDVRLAYLSEDSLSVVRISDCSPVRLTPAGLSLSLMLRPTVSRPVCLGIKHPSGAYDQTLITVRQLQVCCCGAFSLLRGRVCRLQMLLALASAVILGSESYGTRDHILLSQNRDFPLSSPPTTRRATVEVFDPLTSGYNC
jgi:hypothetical protein